MASLLPPLPQGVPPGHSYWNDWYEKLRSIIDGLSTGTAWALITGTPTTLSGYGITDAQSKDSDLTALASTATTGLYTVTGSGTSATRTIVAGSSKVTISNGSGVSGNPSIDVDTTTFAANPTATVGLTAANGSATTHMRSDASPALSQSISPTWSGTHTFSNPITAASFIPTSSTVPTNGVYLPTANTVSISTASTERVRIDSSGVLVGETSAGYSSANRGLVEINGSSSALVGFRVGSVNKGYLFHSGTDMFLSNDVSGAVVFNINTTEQFRIDSSGKASFSSGVLPTGGGFKHTRITTGSIAAASTALITITWGSAFADANYTVSASVVDSTTSSLSLSVVHVESITASAVTVRVLNNAAGSLTGTLHVIAIHD